MQHSAIRKTHRGHQSADRHLAVAAVYDRRRFPQLLAGAPRSASATARSLKKMSAATDEKGFCNP